MDRENLTIDRGKVTQYFILASIPFLIMSMFFICTGWFSIISDAAFWYQSDNQFIFAVFSVIVIFMLGMFLLNIICPMEAAALDYYIDGDLLIVKRGAFFTKYQTIPIKNITDLSLCQNPFMKIINMWKIDVQTAGSSIVEAKLYGIVEPEKAREYILSKRN